MRKSNLLLCLVALTFMGCASFLPTEMPTSFSGQTEIMAWIYNNIEYDGVLKTVDTVQTAQQTLAIRKGTCYDMCVLFIYLNKGGELFPVKYRSGWHMLVKDPVFGFYDVTNNMYLGYSLPSYYIPTTLE